MTIHWALVVVLVSVVLGVPFSVERLHEIRRVGDYTRNQKGDLVYTIRTWDPDTSDVTTNLQISLSGTGKSVPLTFSEANADTSPTFTPDGNYVFFISTRSGSSQVWTVPVNGTDDDVVQLSDFPVDIDNLKWVIRPDGDYLLYTIQVYPNCTSLQCTADRDSRVKSRGANTWRYYDSLFVRHWDQWETGKVSHIFLQKIVRTNSWTLVGSPLDLMAGLAVNSPVPPFGGLEQIDISPDGTELAFTGEVVDHTSAWSTGWKIYIVPTDGKTGPSSITEFTKAQTSNPRYSPDSTTIAYLAMDRPGFESDMRHVNLFNRTSGKTVAWTRAVDISLSDIVWDFSGSFLIGDADDYGLHNLFPIPVRGNPPTTLQPLFSNGTNSNVQRTWQTNSFYVTRQSMNTPVDIWMFKVSIQGSQMVLQSLVQVTSENAELLAQIEFSTPIRFSFIGSNNDRVFGWVLQPYGWTPGQKAPVAQLIHGGPQGSWGDDWSYRWNPQVWAGHGYAVLVIDFHGSTGYGQAFTDSIRGHWGSLPYWDIMNGTMAALQQFSWMDGTRVGALGASYGGFMVQFPTTYSIGILAMELQSHDIPHVNWIHGHTDFFKALVTHDGIFDTFSAYYSTEELWFPEWEFMGTPWENPSLYSEWNPASFVQNWKVPHLIIHGGRDYRLPVTQGLSAFTVLQRKGIPSALLEYDLENHWVLNDSNGIKWYQTVFNWLDMYVAGTVGKLNSTFFVEMQ